MSGKVKGKGKGTPAEGAAPVAPATKPTHIDGIPATGKGVADKRYKFAPGTRPVKAARAAPGVTRKAKMAEVLSGKMTFVREGYDPNGVHSVTGAHLKRYFVIANEAGDELMVGRGEMVKYAGITPPSKRVKKEKAADEVAGAFEGGAGQDDVEPEAGVGDGEAQPAGGDLSFLDES